MMNNDLVDVRKEKTIELLKLTSNLDNSWGNFEKRKEPLLSWMNKNDYLYNDTSLSNVLKELRDVLSQSYDELALHIVRYLILQYRYKKYYYVYKHTVPNGKSYIGVTCQSEFEFRWNDGYKKNTDFSKAIEEFGWENIKHEIIFTNLSSNEAAEAEKMLIREYKTTDSRFGYNKDKGGRLTHKRVDIYKYDVLLQYRGRRRPFKFIVPKNELLSVKTTLLSIYDSYIIHQEELKLNDEEMLYIIATNPSFKEENIKKYLEKYKETHPDKKITFVFHYGKNESDAFSYNSETQTFSINMYAIDMKFYKYESAMDDLAHTLLQLC